MEGIILNLKKLLKPVAWKVLDIYEQNLSSKGRKAKEFERFVKKINRIYFTTDINTNGFSDRITRLLFFHKVGESLGFIYHFTPLVSVRSNTIKPEEKLDSFENIYDFIGINTFLKKHPHVDYLGIDHASEQVILDTHNYDIRKISNQIKKFLESREKNPGLIKKDFFQYPLQYDSHECAYSR